MDRRFHSDDFNIEAMRINGRFLDTVVFKSGLTLTIKLFIDHLSLCFYTPAKAMNKLFLDTISTPSVSNYIPRQAGHNNLSVTTYVYKAFNSTFGSGFIQHKVSHANRYERVKNNCNSYAGKVYLSWRRTAIFFKILNTKGEVRQCI